MHARQFRSLAVALAALAAAALAGCYTEGGGGASMDRFTYISRTWQPWTVGLVDTRTGEEIWSVDIPVGQQLVMRFRRGKNPAELLPDSMDWEIMKAGKTYGTLENALPVPPRDARLLRPTLRPTPELPGATLASRGPSPAGETLEPAPRDDRKPEPQYEPLPTLEPVQEPIEIKPAPGDKPAPGENPEGGAPAHDPGKTPTWDEKPREGEGEGEEEPPIDLPEDEDPGR